MARPENSTLQTSNGEKYAGPHVEVHNYDWILS
jgi:hypothetical protein